MNTSPQLERRYRRLLAWYPRSFRAENEEEVLAVLLACAQDGQTRPDLGARADLLRGALRMRARPPARPPWALVAAVRLMCLGAVLELGAVITIVATWGSIRPAARRAEPNLTALQWNALTAHSVATLVGSILAVALWVWLAWFTSRGNDMARFVYASFFALLSLGLLYGVAGHALVIAPADFIAEAAAWAVSFVGLVLIFTPQASRFYRSQTPQPAQA